MMMPRHALGRTGEASSPIRCGEVLVVATRVRHLNGFLSDAGEVWKALFVKGNASDGMVLASETFVAELFSRSDWYGSGVGWWGSSGLGRGAEPASD